MILGTGNCNRRPQRLPGGFSLLEMMLVIAVVGILYGVAFSKLGLSVGDPLNDEVDRLHRQVLLAQDESVVRSQPLALGFARDGYGFFLQDKQSKWKPITQDTQLGSHRFATPLKPTLYVDGQALALPTLAGIHPQVFILPTGEMKPFEWHLTSGGRDQMVKFNTVGQPVTEAQPK